MTMKKFTNYLLRGILTLLPLVLTVYPLYYFFSWTDRIAQNLVEPFIPVYEYIPGTGMVLGIVTLFLLGLLMSSQYAERIYSIIELPFRNIPIVNSLYNALKELANFLAPSDERVANKVVLVRFPGYEFDVIGFVMREAMDDMPAEIEKEERCVVYIPMSYQVGGFTLFLPNDWLTPIDMPVETAMKNTLTGWITREDGQHAH